MAARTPTTIYRESAGSLTMHIANFAAGATTLDTWASGIPGIMAYWANALTASNTTTNSNGITVLATGSTLHFRADTDAETMTQFQCIVLSKS